MMQEQYDVTVMGTIKPPHSINRLPSLLGLITPWTDLDTKSVRELLYYSPNSFASSILSEEVKYFFFIKSLSSLEICCGVKLVLVFFSEFRFIDSFSKFCL